MVFCLLEQENMITRRRKDVECAIEAECSLFYRDVKKGQEKEGEHNVHLTVDASIIVSPQRMI